MTDEEARIRNTIRINMRRLRGARTRPQFAGLINMGPSVVLRHELTGSMRISEAVQVAKHLKISIEEIIGTSTEPAILQGTELTDLIQRSGPRMTEFVRSLLADRLGTQHPKEGAPREC